MNDIRYDRNNYKDPKILQVLKQPGVLTVQKTKYDRWIIFEDWLSGMSFTAIGKEHGISRESASQLVYCCIAKYHEVEGSKSPKQKHQQYRIEDYQDYDLFMETCLHVGAKTRRAFADWRKGVPTYKTAADIGAKYESTMNMRRNACRIYDYLKELHEKPGMDFDKLVIRTGYSLADPNVSKVKNTITRRFNAQFIYSDLVGYIANLTTEEYMRFPNAGKTNKHIFEDIREECRNIG